jgi:molybdenum cofactor cytidylyltransferase
MAAMAKPRRNEASNKPLWALVLAAGAGSRFGGGKLMALWRGRPLIEAALATAFAAPVEGVVLATGADPAVAEAAKAFAGDRPLEVVVADDWSDGLSASLKAGLKALPEAAEGVLVFLGDMPRVPTAVLEPLARALETASAAVPVWRSEIGHPAAISRTLFPSILDLEGDRGARGLLLGLGPALIRIEAPDDGVLFDVDRPQDLDQS